jgi:hypothetical protein
MERELAERLAQLVEMAALELEEVLFQVQEATPDERVVLEALQGACERLSTAVVMTQGITPAPHKGSPAN